MLPVHVLAVGHTVGAFFASAPFATVGGGEGVGSGDGEGVLWGEGFPFGLVFVFGGVAFPGDIEVTWWFW